jgi:hypothetical protein
MPRFVIESVVAGNARQTAAAPPTISDSSLVMPACRVLL